MNIAVDATCWKNLRGYGRYARALLTTLTKIDHNNRYIFVLDSDVGSDTIPDRVEVNKVITTQPAVQAASATGARSLIDMWRVSSRMAGIDCDVILFPTVYTYVPVISKAKKIVVIHDVIPEKYPHLTFSNRKSRLFWNIKSKAGRFQADAIVTVSEYAKRSISQYFNIDPKHIYIVGEASDPVFRPIKDPILPQSLFSQGVKLGDRWLVYVGGFGPHKNLSALLVAFSKLIREKDFEDLKLVLVGEYRKEVFFSSIGDLQYQLDALGINERIIFTGFISDEELVNVLNLSAVLVLPSLMEGYGLPGIEAAASGCPVIATSHSALPEVLGDVCLYINPEKTEEIEDAIREVLTASELRERMISEGLQKVRALTWDKSAREMLQVINMFRPS